MGVWHNASPYSSHAWRQSVKQLNIPSWLCQNPNALLLPLYADSESSSSDPRLDQNAQLLPMLQNLLTLSLTQAHTGENHGL